MTIRPISISKSIWYFIISSAIIYLGLYICIPLFQTKGIPFFVGYLIFFHIPILLLIPTAIILFRSEGNIWNWTDFKKRILLTKMNKTDWKWAIGLFLFGIIVYIGLSPVGSWLSKISFFKPPDFFPAEINPNKISVPGYMMDYKLSGQYWLPFAYLVAWVSNILGEEILFRGMLFPRQIKKYGSKAWIYHGLIWTFWHFFWTWNLVSIFPFAMTLSYVIYKRQNIWISIFAHGTMNSIPLILIIIEVIK
jgi:membrane protease YdiL (CAAX protease family)